MELMLSPNTDIALRQPLSGLGGKEELRLLAMEAVELPMLGPPMNTILTVPTHKDDSKAGARIAEIVDAISSHHSLARSILKVANSDSFGLSQDAPNVARAIDILGYDAVRSLALGALVMESAARRESCGLFDRKRFWLHSLACAYISKRIAAMTHLAKMEPSFVSGLLHDVGKVFLAIHLPETYKHAIAFMGTGPFTSVQSEDRTLGFTHAEVGLWLAQRWRLPKSVVFAIANHHGEIEHDERYSPLTSILRLADHVCRLERISGEDDAFIEPFDKGALNELRIGNNELAVLRKELAGEKEKLQALA
jgi:putative nucleotidyltransferase with HDIG domain